jgi:hypothetical protein
MWSFGKAFCDRDTLLFVGYSGDLSRGLVREQKAKAHLVVVGVCRLRLWGNKNIDIEKV